MVLQLLNRIERLRRDTFRATDIEYGLIAAGIAIVIIGALA